MYFLDEAGQDAIPDLNPKLDPVQDNYFVFGGVIIWSPEWRQIREIVRRTKEDFHITLREELKWRNLVRRSGPASHLTEDQALAYVKNLAERLTGLVTGIVAVIFKNESYRLAQRHPKRYIKSGEDIYHQAFRYCLQRLALFLHDKSDTEEEAIVVADRRSDQQDNRLRRHFEELVYESTQRILYKGSFERVVEGLFLQVSHYSVGVQLADILAGAVHQKYAKGGSRWYQYVEPWLRRSPSGQILGWGLIEHPNARMRKFLATG